MKDLYKDMLSIIIGILLVQLLWSSFNNDFMIKNINKIINNIFNI